jgi:hypothetical protein
MHEIHIDASSMLLPFNRFRSLNADNTALKRGRIRAGFECVGKLYSSAEGVSQPFLLVTHRNSRYTPLPLAKAFESC